MHNHDALTAGEPRDRLAAGQPRDRRIRRVTAASGVGQRYAIKRGARGKAVSAAVLSVQAKVLWGVLGLLSRFC